MKGYYGSHAVPFQYIFDDSLGSRDIIRDADISSISLELIECHVARCGVVLCIIHLVFMPNLV